MYKLGGYLLFCLLVVAGAFGLAYSPFPVWILLYGALSGLALEWTGTKIWPKKDKPHPTVEYTMWFATLTMVAILGLQIALAGIEKVVTSSLILSFVAPMMAVSTSVQFLRQRRQVATQ